MATRVVSDTSLTAVADAIREKGGTSSPLTFPDGFVDAIGDIETGGGGGVGVVEPSDVNFIDYDGTILYSYSAAEAQALTELPANPSHEGLISQGWNWSLADMKAQVTAIGGCDIGQMYITDDNKTRLYCHFEESTRKPYLRISVLNTVIVDWGDGSTTTLSSNSMGIQCVQHIYASAGDYVISLNASNGTLEFGGASSLARVLGNSNATSPADIDRPYLVALKKVELGINTTVSNSAFQSTSIQSITIPKSVKSMNGSAFRECYYLKSITIPDEMSSLASYLFDYCYSLVSVSIPKSVTTLDSYAFDECHSLKRVELPSTVTYLATSIFSFCYSLKTMTLPNEILNIYASCFRSCHFLESISLPSELKTIAANAFNLCRSLKVLIIPDKVGSIAANAFNSCFGITEYHFKATTPPLLANTNAFSSIASTCKIYVPYSADHSVLNAYKTATNWSAYASKMVEEAAS